MTQVRLICLVLITAALRALGASAPGLEPIAPGQAFTFVVLGDNRGDDSGQQPAAFLQVLDAVERQSPALILDTGDMIYGHSSDEHRVRDQWRIYREAIRRARAPMFHVPGNHDIWDDSSARIYVELWGKTYYAFDYGNARFIGLDTESTSGQLGEEQFHWLEHQLENFTQRNVFVFFHRPLFPTDGAIGSSLDEHPAERDRIHQLFVQHRDVIRGVFAGHEHLYSFQQREGVPYYTSGGGGAPLYTAPELGGFHHFLVVRVGANKVEVQLKRVSAPTRRIEEPSRVLPGQVLESWKQGLIWYAWDRTASIELTPERASKGRRGLRLNFDLNQYAWPVLVLPLAKPWDLVQYQSLSLDVYVPRALGESFALTPALDAGRKFSAPLVSLRPGWNTITTPLDAPWLPSEARGKVDSLEWSLSDGGNRTAGFVVFDNLRAERRGSGRTGPAELLESFERPLLWRVFDESVRAEMIETNGPAERRGLRLGLDFAKCDRPITFAQLNPPWDLTKVQALLLEMAADDSLPTDLTIELCLRSKDVEYTTPPARIPRSGTPVRFELKGSWLPQQARTAVEQVGFRFSSTNSAGACDITLQKLSAAGNF